MTDEKENNRVHDQASGSTQNDPAMRRVFIGSHIQFQDSFSNDLGDRMRAAFKARAFEQGLNASSSSHASCHVSRSGPVTEIGGTARGQAGNRTATVVWFRRST